MRRTTIPSKSKAQAKLMNIAAHTPGGYGGVSQSVGKEFHAADKVSGKFKKPSAKKIRKSMYGSD